MDSDELKRRTFEFGIRIIRLVRALPKTPEGNAIGGQLVRAGTAVGANYRATCKARSRAEFVAKIGVVEEEADESAYWTEMIIGSQMLRQRVVEPLLNEAKELSKIFGKSRVTASSRLSSHTKSKTPKPNGQ